MSSLSIDLTPRGDGHPFTEGGGDSKCILPENRAAVLLRLRKFYHAEQLYPSSSKASHSSGRAQSVSSAETTQTDMTRVFSIENFSIENGSEQRGELSKPLHPALKARKTLMRKLGTCKGDCRARKVQCKLYHHRLQDLLEGNNSLQDQRLIDWALHFDDLSKNDAPPQSVPGSGPLTTGNTGPGLETVIDEVDDQFPDLGPQGEPQQLEMQIEDFNADYASLLAEEPSSRTGGTETETSSAAFQQVAALPQVQPRASLVGHRADQYCTSRVSQMFPIGEQFQVVYRGITLTGYGCCAVPECPEHFSTISDILTHYRNEHAQFRGLEGDPRRMVCPSPRCDEFHPHSTEICRRCLRRKPVIKVYGQNIPVITLTPWTTKVPSSSQKFGNQSGVPQPPAAKLQQSQSGNSQGDSHESKYSRSSHGFSSYTRSFVTDVKNKILLWLSYLYLFSPHRRLRELVFHSRFPAALGLLFVLALLNYEIRDWMIAKLSRFWHDLSHNTPVEEPMVGGFIMAVAFATYRCILHVHSHRTSGCRRGRCPIRYVQNIRLSCTGPGTDQADAEDGYARQHRRSAEVHEE